MARKKMRKVSLPDKQAALQWVLDWQLARRNLTPDAASYLRGKRYELEKQTHGGDRKKGAKMAPLKARHLKDLQNRWVFLQGQ